MLFLLLCLMKIPLFPSGEGQGKNRRRTRRTSRSSDQDRRSTLQVSPCCGIFLLSSIRCIYVSYLSWLFLTLYHFYFLSKSFKEVCPEERMDSKLILKKKQGTHSFLVRLAWQGNTCVSKCVISCDMRRLTGIDTLSQYYPRN